MGRPQQRKKLIAGITKAENRTRIAKAMRARWADPLLRKQTTEHIRAGQANPAVREKIAAAMKRRWADPASRKKMIATLKAAGQRRKRRRETTG